VDRQVVSALCGFFVGWFLQEATQYYFASVPRLYTSHGYKLRFFKELKTQGERRIKIGFVSGHGFFQAL
jgi:hypothetical protein